ncbi:unnamed protein product [Heligmosomoides polygyrus]|uniref:Endo/exonuclease/phosphatase domain-containing protein n=1 Tax=Heligmosomoides polygyrus TaxID=6339 RepID=A0A183FML1_HELPZ|nr:unnamed protein product [Heligmosomoides polygyrus]
MATEGRTTSAKEANLNGNYECGNNDRKIQGSGRPDEAQKDRSPVPGNEMERGEGQEDWRRGQAVLQRRGHEEERCRDSCGRVSHGFDSCCPKESDRIMFLRLDTKEGYWTVMSVYAPQTGCPEHEKDEFYLMFKDAMRSVPEGDYLSIAGDMNGHVGTRRRGVERVHGGKGVGMVNPDGERIIDLAAVHDLVILAPSSRRGRARR